MNQPNLEEIYLRFSPLVLTYLYRQGTDRRFEAILAKIMKRITFYVGPNGCGKTRTLVKDAENSASKPRSSIAIANTSFARFPYSSERFPVFRVSPRGIKSIVSRNLENLFGSDGKGIFAVTDLLESIGFEPKIDLEVRQNKRAILQPLFYDEVTDTLNSPYERGATIDFLGKLRGSGDVKLELVGGFDSFKRSVSEENRVILRNLPMLKNLNLVSGSAMIFYHKERGSQRFGELSSGEQTIISTFLFIKSNLKGLDAIFIDEPENSLHPDWQRKYLDTIHMALGYEKVSIVLATHSPVLVSGALSGYKNDVEVVRIRKDRREVLDIYYSDGPESVEEILWSAFDTLTPVSHFLSLELSRILQNLTDGEISYEQAQGKIFEFREKSYDRKQELLLNRVVENLERFVPNA